MTDSLFSGRNHYDEQLARFDQIGITLLIEASTRRLTDIKGPLYASGRLQRLADICAGVHVMPIDHWRGAPAPAPEKPKGKLRRFFGSITWSYWGGLAVGFYLGSTWR